MRRKGATPISVVLVVLMVLVLVLFSLFTFLTSKIKNEKFIHTSYNEVYAKESEINFYLQQGKKLEEIPKLVSLENGKIELEYGEIIITKLLNENLKVVYRFKPKGLKIREN